ncbi:MAG: homoserine kinase [Myxococcales bacterium]|nr:homoserine kinase [Myxococcales bacterium]
MDLTPLPRPREPLTFSVPATAANLGPGFDCLGAALDLRNRFAWQPAPTGVAIACSGPFAAGLPVTGANLCAVAYARAAVELAGHVPPCALRVQAEIPTQAGLGSSATAVVAGVFAAFHATGTPYAAGLAADLAGTIEGHPDNVAPALLGGWVVAVFERGRVTALRLEPPLGAVAVAVTPALAVPTVASRQRLPQHVTHAAATFSVGRVALLVAALQASRLDLLGTAMQDRLHEPSRMPGLPGAEAARAAGLAAGAYGCVLSGSGPTLLALCPPAAVGTIGAAMRDAFGRAGVHASVRALPWSADGVRVEAP